jgi:hypothetical protein
MYESVNRERDVYTAQRESQETRSLSRGAVLDALGCIGSAVALFSVVKRQHEGFALGFVTTRMFEAAVIVIGVVSIIAVVTLRQTAAEADAASLVAVGLARAPSLMHFLLGPGLMPAFNAALLGYLMYRSGLVALLIPAMGLIGAPLLTSSTLGMRLGVNERGSVGGRSSGPHRSSLLLGAVPPPVDDVQGLQPIRPYFGRAFC